MTNQTSPSRQQSIIALHRVVASALGCRSVCIQSAPGNPYLLHPHLTGNVPSSNLASRHSETLISGTQRKRQRPSTAKESKHKTPSERLACTRVLPGTVACTATHKSFIVRVAWECAMPGLTAAAHAGSTWSGGCTRSYSSCAVCMYVCMIT